MDAQNAWRRMYARQARELVDNILDAYHRGRIAPEVVDDLRLDLRREAQRLQVDDETQKER